MAAAVVKILLAITVGSVLAEKSRNSISSMGISSGSNNASAAVKVVVWKAVEVVVQGPPVSNILAVVVVAEIFLQQDITLPLY